MNLEEKLKEYKKIVRIEPEEEKIKRTIEKSQKVYLMSEQKNSLSYHEFLWSQMRIIKKRWWIFQALILFMLWWLLLYAGDDKYIQKSMAVIATLFVVLIIPEFMKNRSYKCMEIEGVCYYSLRQIYAARLVLFGITDVFLLTLFCEMAVMGLNIRLEEIMVQFLLPLTVTACICFGTLCSKYHFNEIKSISLCGLWSFIWMSVILNENVYKKITLPIWASLFSLACVYLMFTVYRMLKNCNNYWEVSMYGTEI